MAKSDEILAEIRELTKGQKDLLIRLYGQESDKGDIPTIRDQVQFINGVIRVHDTEIAKLKERSQWTKKQWVWIIIAILGGGGGATGIITKLLEVW